MAFLAREVLRAIFLLATFTRSNKFGLFHLKMSERALNLLFKTISTAYIHLLISSHLTEILRKLSNPRKVLCRYACHLKSSLLLKGAIERE